MVTRNFDKLFRRQIELYVQEGINYNNHDELECTYVSMSQDSCITTFFKHDSMILSGFLICNDIFNTKKTPKTVSYFYFSFVSFQHALHSCWMFLYLICHFS